MIRFGLHLTLRGGREAVVRLVVIAVAVAIGVGLLLATLSSVRAVDTQNARYAWLNSGIPDATAPDAVPSPDPLWGTLATDHYAGRSIIRGRPRGDRTRRARSRPGCRGCPGPASTTPRPRCWRCCGRRRPTSWTPATPAGRSARSATRRCRPPAR